MKKTPVKKKKKTARPVRKVPGTPPVESSTVRAIVEPTPAEVAVFDHAQRRWGINYYEKRGGVWHWIDRSGMARKVKMHVHGAYIGPDPSQCQMCLEANCVRL